MLVGVETTLSVSNAEGESMTSSITFLLTENKVKTLESRYKQRLRCVICGELLRAGDKVYSQQTRLKRKHYHMRCWLSLFR